MADEIEYIRITEPSIKEPTFVETAEGLKTIERIVEIGGIRYKQVFTEDGTILEQTML